LRGNIERILSAWGAPFPPLMVYEGVQRRRFPAEKKTGVTVGLLRPGRHRSPKPTRFKRLKSTLFLLMGRPEERSESATRGTWICVWDKPRHRSKLQRATNPLEKRPIRQNTLNFSFRGLDNGVNYTFRVGWFRRLPTRRADMTLCSTPPPLISKSPHPILQKTRYTYIFLSNFNNKTMATKP